MEKKYMQFEKAVFLSDVESENLKLKVKIGFI